MMVRIVLFVGQRLRLRHEAIRFVCNRALHFWASGLAGAASRRRNSSTSSPSHPGQHRQAAPQNQIAPQPPPPPPPQEERRSRSRPSTRRDIVTDSSVDRSKIVYVSDFELDAVDGQGKLEKSVPAVSVTNPSPSREQLRRKMKPAEQAGRLVDFMAITLIVELRAVRLQRAPVAARRFAADATEFASAEFLPSPIRRIDCAGR